MVLTKNNRQKKTKKRSTRKIKKCRNCNNCHSYKVVCEESKSVKIGGAGLHLAYTYIVLNNSVFVHHAKFKEYIIKQVIKSISYMDENAKNIYFNFILWITSQPSNKSQVIISMKYNYINLIYKNGEFDDTSNAINKSPLLDNEQFLENILGHAFLISNDNYKELQIENICLHRRGDERSNDISSFLTGPYANVLVTNIVFACSSTFVNPSMYHLRIVQDIQNPHFSDIIKSYTLFGFGNISFTDELYSNDIPSSGENSIKFIEFKKIDLGYYPEVEIAKSYENQALNLRNLLSDVPIVINIVFEEVTFNYLRLFPYLGREYGITKIEANDIVEYGGTFKIAKKNEQQQYVMAIDDYLVGDFEMTHIPEAPYVFHSHPISLYIKYNVAIGTPSGPDIQHTINLWKQYCNNDTIMSFLGTFHFVVSIEGIYVVLCSFEKIYEKCRALNIDLNINECLNKLNDDEVARISEELDYPFHLRQFNSETGDNIWNQETFDNLSEDTTNNYVNSYLIWFRNTAQQIPIFYNVVTVSDLIDIHYYSWRNIGEGTPIRFNRNIRDFTDEIDVDI